ncbi:hypothetical protein LOTGIDRAFT_120476 [Lottia gigantea]|uniref:Protein phosphatase 1 regulatory subunit 42 n=1 Tax=Lottia gigantea TaxID=225164 RepID=V4AGG8_LOTGI|nr:hypothetical protein LOTGIDRAFT_120476 [Lottia gigantea]ESO92506.1 hypothetical protein LOTGIDRAFT_120476 [Lottia gigantea]
MVKLTTDLMTRGTSGHNKKKRDESQNQFLSRLTHLYLEEKGIDDVNELGLCRNLVVLYLYDNQLIKVPALHQNNNLTHLYLQNNFIRKIEGLSTLTQLTKLYLGGNAITVLEGIENLRLLQELQVENQQLPLGEKLLFDPRSLNSICQCIQVLNISGNNIDCIRELENARKLFHLMCSDNNISDLKELSHVLNRLTQLRRLDLIGNPICHKAKYRDRIIVMSKQLQMLDGKEITDTSRQFLQNWQATKEAQKKKKEEMNKNGYPEGNDS